ncbi:MAG: hypothetical protein LBR53_08890 [Deltaproteobacteria bacterium]|nr:hypothetical protein [Deltaproteobacteria bacterium]
MADEKLLEGIYLQTKKSTIGTGSTAKHAEYRNFWVTLSITDTYVEMILLDDAFMLTGIRERFSLEEVTGANWLYVEQGAKKFSQLKPKLDSILNPPAKQPSSKACPPARGTAPGRTPTIFGSSKKPANGAQTSKKDGWWTK